MSLLISIKAKHLLDNNMTLPLFNTKHCSIDANRKSLYGYITTPYLPGCPYITHITAISKVKTPVLRNVFLKNS